MSRALAECLQNQLKLQKLGSRSVRLFSLQDQIKLTALLRIYCHYACAKSSVGSLLTNARAFVGTESESRLTRAVVPSFRVDASVIAAGRVGRTFVHIWAQSRSQHVWLYNLPQYFANLKQLIVTKKGIHLLGKFIPVLTTLSEVRLDLLELFCAVLLEFACSKRSYG